MNRSGVDDQLHIAFNVLRFLRPAVVDNGPLLFQTFRQRGTVPVRAGDRKAFGKKDFRESAHADSADADKIDMDRMIKIYLIDILYMRHRSDLPF